MNFTTDLPKRNPLVSYIVASAVRCEKFFPGQTKGGPVYRMHAVILKTDPRTNMQKTAGKNSEAEEIAKSKRELYICCHVRRVELGEENENSKSTEGGPDKLGKTPKAARASGQKGVSIEGLSPSKQSSLHGQFSVQGAKKQTVPYLANSKDIGTLDR